VQQDHKDPRDLLAPKDLRVIPVCPDHKVYLAPPAPLAQQARKDQPGPLDLSDLPEQLAPQDPPDQWDPPAQPDLQGLPDHKDLPAASTALPPEAT
jgi:hypothetical protein